MCAVGWKVAISLLVWSFHPNDVNVFVTDLTVDNVVTHMQGIFKWNFDHLVLETV